MKWGTRETFLLSNNLTLPNAELARRLKRTEQAVKCKKNRMGLSAVHPRWSPEDVRILKMGCIPAGRTPEACRRRRRRMADAREE